MTMWAKQNNYKTQSEELLEMILIALICFVLGFVFFYDYGEPSVVSSEPKMDTFNQYPLQA